MEHLRCKLPSKYVSLADLGKKIDSCYSKNISYIASQPITFDNVYLEEDIQRENLPPAKVSPLFNESIELLETDKSEKQDLKWGKSKKAFYKPKVIDHHIGHNERTDKYNALNKVRKTESRDDVSKQEQERYMFDKMHASKETNDLEKKAHDLDAKNEEGMGQTNGLFVSTKVLSHSSYESDQVPETRQIKRLIARERKLNDACGTKNDIRSQKITQDSHFHSLQNLEIAATSADNTDKSLREERSMSVKTSKRNEKFDSGEENHDGNVNIEARDLPTAVSTGATERHRFKDSQDEKNGDGRKMACWRVKDQSCNHRPNKANFSFKTLAPNARNFNVERKGKYSIWVKTSNTDNVKHLKEEIKNVDVRTENEIGKSSESVAEPSVSVASFHESGEQTETDATKERLDVDRNFQDAVERMQEIAGESIHQKLTLQCEGVRVCPVNAACEICRINVGRQPALENQQSVQKFDPQQWQEQRCEVSKLWTDLKVQAETANETMSNGSKLKHEEDFEGEPASQKIDYFNKYLNEEQLKCVGRLLKWSSFVPYLIYGPTGTGKTSTIVEAILQIFKKNLRSCILACTPSIGSSHALHMKLVKYIAYQEILRFYVPNYSSHRKSYLFEKDFLRFRIVIATYSSAASFQSHRQGVCSGHFTHVFLDESGQACEPETLAPIVNLVSKDTAVVLAGDPHLQTFGRVCCSSDVLKSWKSYLEWCSLCQLSPDVQNTETKTELAKNYRSHPEIAKVVSDTFYQKALISCVPQKIEISLTGWVDAPNKIGPVLITGSKYFNNFNRRSQCYSPQQIRFVLSLLETVKNNNSGSIAANDIGIIMPSSEHIWKFQRIPSLRGIKVGEVEQFQGDEKAIIIVLPNPCGDMGRLRSPKYFNVAVSRARQLLVVMGNKFSLAKDGCWRKLLQYRECSAESGNDETIYVGEIPVLVTS